jgi:sorbitol/mannitol transport system substrate-binding protein
MQSGAEHRNLNIHQGDNPMKLKMQLSLAASLVLALCGPSQAATELVIATVNNGHMIEMQKLSGNVEKANPDIKLK